MDDDLIRKLPPKLREAWRQRPPGEAPPRPACEACRYPEDDLGDLNPVLIQQGAVCDEHVTAYWQRIAESRVLPLIPRLHQTANQKMPGVPDITFDPARGLFLYGSRSGTGKTYQAAVAVKRTWMQRVKATGYPPTVAWWNTPRLFSALRDTMNGHGSQADLMRQLLGCDLLVLDDLGAEKPTVWVTERLYEIINQRLDDKRPCIVTSNFTMDALEKRLSVEHPIEGERVVRRINDGCQPVLMNEPGWWRK